MAPSTSGIEHSGHPVTASTSLPSLAPVDWAANRARLLGSLPTDGLVILFSGAPAAKSADEDYPYAPNRNFLYVTGLDRPNQVVVLGRCGGAVDGEVAFIEPIDPHAETWTGKMMTPDEARQVSGIEDVRPVAGWRPYVNRLLSSGRWPTVYLDLERRAWAEPPSESLRFAHELADRHPGQALANCYPMLAELRRIKSAAEVDRVRGAVAHTRRGFEAILRHVRPGCYEYELNGHFTGTLLGGGVDIAYGAIVATGVNATVMHYITLRDQVGADDAVLVDAAAQFGYYKADITRTFPAAGRFTAEQSALYDVVWEASQEATAAIRPGLPHAELNRITRRVLAKGMKALGHMRDDSELDQYYFYNVSHYLGLDTHDVGEYRELEPGMVLTIEPGLYLKHRAVGIRIEDDIAVTASGADILSADIPNDRRGMEEWLAACQASRT